MLHRQVANTNSGLVATSIMNQRHKVEQRSAALLLCCLLLLACSCPLHALNNGVARRPFMGFNTWNYFYCDINQTIIRDTIDAFVDLGLKAAGYEYITIDDCWHAPERDAHGQLQPHPERFPDGIEPLVEYAHQRGLKLGIYSDAGYNTCDGLPGSYGYEREDAQLFASWGVDLLKYDNCYAPDMDVKGRYEVMRDALLATGRPIVYSLCSWGVGQPWLWGAAVGNSYRIDDDVAPRYSDIIRSLDAAIGLSRYAGPGAWNDPDMLEVGNGNLLLSVQRAHFALWALLKSPLIIGTDLRSISPESLQILKAREVIGINQDELGVAGDLVYQQGLQQVWAAPLRDGARAVILFNRQVSHGLPLDPAESPVNMTVHWSSIGYDAGVKVVVRDLYAGKNLGTATGSFTVAVNGQDAAVLRLTPVAPHPDHEAWRPWHSALQQELQAARSEMATRLQLVPSEARKQQQVQHLGRRSRRGGPTPSLVVDTV